MSFYDDASLVVIPSGYKTSKVYSVKPTDGSGDLTFSRSNDTATRVNSAGLIERVRTNLILQSQTLDNASWTKSASSVTANTTTAPDGTSTADTWTADGTAATHGIIQSGTATLANGTTYSTSIYAKKGTNDFIQIIGSSSPYGSLNVFANFDLNNGVVGTVGSLVTATIKDAGNGWYRCTMIAAAAATTSTNTFIVQIVSSASAARGQSNSLSTSVFLWGAQLEVSDFGPTSYIPTTSAAVSVGPVANVPRLDYLNSSCPRLLLEPQRTNLIQYSEQFNNAWWSPSNSTISANAVTSPDGYTNADNLVENTANSTHGVGNVSGLTLTAAAYTFSVFVKKQNRNFFAISTYDGSSTLEGYFNINTGAVATMPAGLTGAITSFGNGWYRCSVTRTMGANANNYFSFNAAATDGGSTYTGTGVVACSIYGGSLELGAYATSYIPTLGAAVTRGADACSKTGISSLTSASEYTIYWEGTHIPTGEYNSFATFYNTANGNYSARFYRNNTNNEIRAAFFNPDTGLSLDLASGVTTQTAKCAVRVKAGSYALYVNGVLVNSSTSALAPASNLNAVNLQYFSSGQSFDQKTGQVLFFKTALSNADLAALTA